MDFICCYVISRDRRHDSLTDLFVEQVWTYGSVYSIVKSYSTNKDPQRFCFFLASSILFLSGLARVDLRSTLDLGLCLIFLQFMGLIKRYSSSSWNSKGKSYRSSSLLHVLSFISWIFGMFFMIHWFGRPVGVDERYRRYCAHHAYTEIGTLSYLTLESFSAFQSYFHLMVLLHGWFYFPPLAIRLFLGAGEGLPPKTIALFLLTALSISRLFRPETLPSHAFCTLLTALLFWKENFHLSGTKLMLFIVAMLVPTTLIPVMDFLWRQTGAANANYVYFQSLVLSVSLSLITLEIVSVGVSAIEHA